MLVRGARFPGTFLDHEPGRWTVGVGMWLGGGQVSEVVRGPMWLVWTLEFGRDSGCWCGVGDRELGGS